MNSLSLFLLKAATAPDDGAISAGISLWRVLGAWLLCIAIAVALIIALRRVRAGRTASGITSFLPGALGAARAIDIVETRRVNLAVDLCLFDYEGERYLVAVGAGGSTLLDRTPRPADPTDRGAP